MTPGPDVVQSPVRDFDPPLGSARAVFEELGPISPELALVDHALAERARKLLPEPPERPRSRPTAATVSIVGPPTLEPRAPQRRWRRTALLAAVVFTAGAASGGFLGRKDGPLSARPSLEAGGAGRTTTSEETRKQVTPPTNEHAPPATTRAKRSGRRTDSAADRRRRPAARRTWAANVLGVAAGVDANGVKLVWEKPKSSDHVVVLRMLRSRKNSVVVFRGRATAYRDDSARPCSEYRYTIVNYDPRGHRSTGVPTSVVTQGCT